jgi:hypothetical protein
MANACVTAPRGILTVLFAFCAGEKFKRGIFSSLLSCLAMRLSAAENAQVLRCPLPVS